MCVCRDWLPSSAYTEKECFSKSLPSSCAHALNKHSLRLAQFFNDANHTHIKWFSIINCACDTISRHDQLCGSTWIEIRTEKRIFSEKKKERVLVMIVMTINQLYTIYPPPPLLPSTWQWNFTRWMILLDFEAPTVRAKGSIDWKFRCLNDQKKSPKKPWKQSDDVIWLVLCRYDWNSTRKLTQRDVMCGCCINLPFLPLRDEVTVKIGRGVGRRSCL